MHRILMFLAHLSWYSQGVPIGKMTRLLGLSTYGVQISVNELIHFGIVRDQWKKTMRLVSLDRKFYGYQSLRDLLLRIDRDTGREFEFLARSYTHHTAISRANRERYAANRRNRRRRLLSAVKSVEKRARKG